jgi:hypothetical protein
MDGCTHELKQASKFFMDAQNGGSLLSFHHFAWII